MIRRCHGTWLAALLLGAAGCRTRLDPLPPKTIDLGPRVYAMTTADYLRDPALRRRAAEVGQV